MRRSLTKKERLGKRSELKNIFENGRSVSCRGAKLFFLENNLTFNRFAVALVRKYGNSVERNRSKRYLRELFRNHKESLLPGMDIIIVLYPGNFRYSDRQKQFYSLLKRGELVKFS